MIPWAAVPLLMLPAMLSESLLPLIVIQASLSSATATSLLIR